MDPPSGRGSGEQWVREQYAKQVQAHRWRTSGRRATTALVVALDADRGDPERRVRQLGQSLESAGMDPRGNDESIIHLIPKRSIETWVLCLTGTRVDEDTDYSRQDIDKKIRPGAERFFEWSRSSAGLPDYCVPSLRLADREMLRLELP